MIKKNYLFLIIILLFFPLINSETTFFDNEEGFIIGSSATGKSAQESGTSEKIIRGDCFTNWVCSSWSSCINEIQTRNCAKNKSYCYADINEKPDESQKCFSEKQNETQEPPQDKDKDKKIKILIFVLMLFAIIIFFAYKISRKIRHKKYGF